MNRLNFSSFNLQLSLYGIMLLAACGGSRNDQSVPGAGSEVLYQNKWVLLQAGTQKIASPGRAHLLFSPGQVGKVSGHSGCNVINSTLELKGTNSLKIGPVATTRMACPPGENDQPFLDALAIADSWEIKGNILSLKKGRNVVARLEGLPVAANLGALQGNWQLTYITGPRIAFDGLYPEKKPTLSFGDKPDQVNGHSSCNPFSAGITLEGDKLSFGQVRSTMMACPGSGEDTFMNMLKKVNRYQVEGNTLTLLEGDMPLMRFARQ